MRARVASSPRPARAGSSRGRAWAWAFERWQRRRPRRCVRRLRAIRTRSADRMTRKQAAAALALVAGTATVVLGAVTAVSEFPRGVVLLACVLIAGASAWYGVLRRGP